MKKSSKAVPQLMLSYVNIKYAFSYIDNLNGVRSAKHIQHEFLRTRSQSITSSPYSLPVFNFELQIILFFGG